MLKILILLCAITSTTYAQGLTKEEITGVWICKRVSLSDYETMPPDEKALAEKVKEGFVTGKFTFDTNGNFNIILPNAGAEIKSMIDGLNNKIWSLEKNVISISRKENLLHIYFIKREGSVVFALYETPFLLTMEKM